MKPNIDEEILIQQVKYRLGDYGIDLRVSYYPNSTKTIQSISIWSPSGNSNMTWTWRPELAKKSVDELVNMILAEDSKLEQKDSCDGRCTIKTLLSGM